MWGYYSAYSCQTPRLRSLDFLKGDISIWLIGICLWVKSLPVDVQMPPLCGEGTMMTSRVHWSLTKPQITSSWQFPFGNFSIVSLYLLIFPNKFGNTDLYTIFEYWFQVCSCILCFMLNPKQCTSESWIWSVGYKSKDSGINSEPQKFLSQEKIRFKPCVRKVLQRHREDKLRMSN